MEKKSAEELDQAHVLRQLMKEIGNETKHHENDLYERVKIDVLHLPPRKEIHGRNKTRFRLTWKMPFIRFTFVIILLIIIVIGALYVSQMNGQ